MAWAIVPKPGSQLGPCAHGCKHVDCAESRLNASEPCSICTKRIGYGVQYCRDEQGHLQHWACAVSKAEAS